MYKENSEYKKIAFSMIAQISSYQIDKNEKFNICTKSIANAICSPLKISYIKKDKIESLQKHANIKIHSTPTEEQRNKYFNACTLRKFANHYFTTEGITAAQLEQFNNIVTEATAAANLLLPKTLHILDAEHIPQIYNHKHTNENNKEPFTIGKIEGLHIGEKSDINASCMQGKPQKYFELYTDLNTDANTLKMAILTQGNEIVARSLIWIDKPAADIDRRKKQNPRHFYIDRIYTKTQDHRAETQTQLYNDLIKYFNIELKADYFNSNDDELNNGTPETLYLPPCFNYYDIRSKIEAEQNTTKEVRCSNAPRFDVEVNQDNYNYYPYADTFQHFNTYNQTLSNDESSDSDILRLDNVSGEASDNARTCDECGCDTDADYMTYIESSDCEVCEDCAIYCEDRQESILISDAIYNNHSGEHHHREDLDI